MRTEDLHDMIHASLFRSFTICLADGQKIPVIHPDLIAHPRGGRVAVVVDHDQRSYYVDEMLITALELAPPAPSPVESLGSESGA